MSRHPLESSHRSELRGFTLIELAVTLTLFGMLMALGLPAFLAWTRNTQVRTVAEALQNGLRTAQAEAVRQNRPVVLAFTASSTSNAASAPWTAVAGGVNWWTQTVPQFTETSGQFIAGGSLGDVASGVTIGNGPAAVCFNSNGRVAAPASGTGVTGATCTATGTVTFNINQTGADRNLVVTLSVGGQVRMCDPKRTLSATTPDGC